jgi:hypothetical protein
LHAAAAAAAAGMMSAIKARRAQFLAALIVKNLNF